MEKQKIEYRCEMIESKERAKLYIYGDISSNDWWDDVISAKKVKDLLKNIKQEKLEVYINSNGGEVFESIAIYNLLKNHTGETVVHVDGLAASGASVVAMAGDKIIMPSNTMMMIHDPWTNVAGNAKTLRETADDLDKITDAVIESYLGHFVGTKDELEVMMKEDTWLTAKDCLTFGLCHQVVEIEKDKTQEEPIKNKLLAKYEERLDTEPFFNEEKEEKKGKEEEEGKTDKKGLWSFFKEDAHETRQIV